MLLLIQYLVYLFHAALFANSFLLSFHLSFHLSCTSFLPFVSSFLAANLTFRSLCLVAPRRENRRGRKEKKKKQRWREGDKKKQATFVRKQKQLNISFQTLGTNTERRGVSVEQANAPPFPALRPPTPASPRPTPPQVAQSLPSPVLHSTTPLRRALPHTSPRPVQTYQQPRLLLPLPQIAPSRLA